MGKLYRIYENGNGLGGVKLGAEVFDAAEGELLVLVGSPSCIHTVGASSNYVNAMCEPASRDVSSMTDAEFAALPDVRVSAAATERATCRHCDGAGVVRVSIAITDGEHDPSLDGTAPCVCTMPKPRALLKGSAVRS